MYKKDYPRICDKYTTMEYSHYYFKGLKYNKKGKGKINLHPICL